MILLGSIASLIGATLLVLAARYLVRRKAAVRNRGLFRFHDGAKLREVDPIGVLLSLEEHPKFRMDLDPRRALQDGDQEALACMADAVRVAFGIKPFTRPGASGLTVYECVELLAVFMLYVDLQKKSPKSFQTSPPSTESTSPSSSAPTTPSMSASGSIGIEPQPS